MVEPKIKTEEAGTESFIVYDCTGKYSGDNKGGYGIPNYRSEDIASYILHITPSGHVGDPCIVDVTGDLPNSENIGVQILPSQMGGSIPSGKLKIKALITFNLKSGGQKTVAAYHTTVLLNKVKCCVDEVIAGLYSGRLTSKADKTAAEEMQFLLQGAEISKCNGWYDNADKILKHLSEQCKCKSC